VLPEAGGCLTVCSALSESKTKSFCSHRWTNSGNEGYVQFRTQKQPKQKELAGMILDKHLTLRKTRMYIKAAADHESMTIFDDFTNLSTCDKDYEKVQKSFDKSIVALRVAMMRLGEVINSMQENWIPPEFLMRHKRMLDAQIDILIKEKMKFNNRL
jgi:hypothetical protein